MHIARPVKELHLFWFDDCDDSQNGKYVINKATVKIQKKKYRSAVS